MDPNAGGGRFQQIMTFIVSKNQEENSSKPRNRGMVGQKGKESQEQGWEDNSQTSKDKEQRQDLYNRGDKRDAGADNQGDEQKEVK